MKKVIKLNLIIYNIIPLIVLIAFTISGIILFKNPFLFISLIIVTYLCIRKLRRMLKHLKKIYDKLDLNEKVIYQNGYTFFYEKYIINIIYDIFIVEYDDIREIYLEHGGKNGLINPNLAIITKMDIKYEIPFITYGPQFFHKMEVLKMSHVIMEQNCDVKLYGKIKKLYEEDFECEEHK